MFLFISLEKSLYRAVDVVYVMLFAALYISLVSDQKIHKIKKIRKLYFSIQE